MIGFLKRNVTVYLSMAFTSSTVTHTARSVAVESLRISSEWENTTSADVNSPYPLWNCTPLRRWKVHSLKSGLCSHFVASAGMGSPDLGSIPSSVSQKGSNWRWSGRETVQKRLLSWNPAEAKIRRLTCAADAGVVTEPITATAASSRPANSEHNLNLDSFIVTPLTVVEL